MDKWLAKFLDGSSENGTDIPDTMPESASLSGMSVSFPKSTGGNLSSVSGMSVQFPKSTGENLPMPGRDVAQVQGVQPGDRVVWRRGDLSWHAAVVDFLHTASDGEEWVFCTLKNGEQNVLNVKFIFDSQKAERRDDETRKT